MLAATSALGPAMLYDVAQLGSQPASPQRRDRRPHPAQHRRYQGMTGIRSTIGWVWQDSPGIKDDPGIDFWLIKAANGDDHTNPAGFDFAENYRSWVDARGANRTAAWTWLYATTDGATAAARCTPRAATPAAT
jgi:hypothetical protein